MKTTIWKWTFSTRVPGSLPQLFSFDPILVLALSRLITTDSFTDESFRYSIFGVLTSRTIIFGMLTSMETIVIFLVCYFLSKNLSFVKINKRNVKRSPDGPLTNLPPRRFWEILVFQFRDFAFRDFWNYDPGIHRPSDRTEKMDHCENLGLIDSQTRRSVDPCFGIGPNFWLFR